MQDPTSGSPEPGPQASADPAQRDPAAVPPAPEELAAASPLTSAETQHALTEALAHLASQEE